MLTNIRNKLSSAVSSLKPSPSNSSISTSASDTQNMPPIQKTESEWRAILSPEQFRILRQKGTEPPGSGEYNKHKSEGRKHF